MGEYIYAVEAQDDGTAVLRQAAVVKRTPKLVYIGPGESWAFGWNRRLYADQVALTPEAAWRAFAKRQDSVITHRLRDIVWNNRDIERAQTLRAAATAALVEFALAEDTAPHWTR